jgi:hypothetical protein
VITLNLLAEEQLAQEARARDPVKLFVVVGLGILTIAVALGGMLVGHPDAKALRIGGASVEVGKDEQWGGGRK